ncbi:MAG TPA: 6,7-dimethyl-8-ribityllumazine synthase [Candidatus Paceibacterota bacterium]|nr:6,7-dimethyl-8-ribityllumazine synthase [Verrucomicrobiota bacterium]HRY46477.1 6,7-dimethyl-8-ribityllumazine synthase [Candidatus Paceibacterota bacterium]HSA01423.1 6,7-dimethyl-8-ribityllumazine synthase [Candidatus Paceibacterota bacterium]
MLRKNRSGFSQQRGGRFAIVASEFNGRYVNSMLKAATRLLEKARVDAIDIYRVPGAFEIPVVAAKLCEKKPGGYSAILCLGVVLRGETTHAQHIGESVSLTLAQLQAVHKIPIIHGVYLFENHEQARVRCLDPDHNRGIELAQTALAMTDLMARIDAGPRVCSHLSGHRTPERSRRGDPSRTITIA